MWQSDRCGELRPHGRWRFVGLLCVLYGSWMLGIVRSVVPGGHSATAAHPASGSGHAPAPAVAAPAAAVARAHSPGRQNVRPVGGWRLVCLEVLQRTNTAAASAATATAAITRPGCAAVAAPSPPPRCRPYCRCHRRLLLLLLLLAGGEALLPLLPVLLFHPRI